MDPAVTCRRTFLTSLLAAAGSALSLPVLARDWSGQNPVRYPDLDIVVIEDVFSKYNPGNTSVQRLHKGALWAEGPAWNAVGRYVLQSDIPNNLLLRRLDDDGHMRLKEAVYRVDAATGKIEKVTHGLAKPNGLCFSPDYKRLYIADTGAPKNNPSLRD